MAWTKWLGRLIEARRQNKQAKRDAERLSRLSWACQCGWDNSRHALKCGRCGQEY